MAIELFRENGASVYVYHRHSYGCFDYVIAFRLGELSLILFENMLWAVECVGKGLSLLIFDGSELVKIEA